MDEVMFPMQFLQIHRNTYRYCNSSKFQRQSMDAPVSLVKLPTEILEAVCSFLNIFHICNMELVSVGLRERLHSTRVWRREAERLAARFQHPLANGLLECARRRELGDRRHFKVMIGVMAQTKRFAADLERAAKQYRGQGSRELEKFRQQQHLAINQTGRGFNMWLKRVVKLYIQEELMVAKVAQVMHYREEISLEEGPWQQVPEERLGDFLPECESAVLEGRHVNDRIRDYVIWVRGVLQPTDQEVQLALQVKSHVILDRIRDLMEDVGEGAVVDVLEELGN